MSGKIPKISVVAPAFNEAGNLAEFCRRTGTILREHARDYEIVIVDDGSTDDTLQVLRQLHRADPRVKYVSLSRNFGHAAAISAGLDHVSGDVVAILDADIQDPPEVLPGFIAKWQEGYHVVYGIRTRRKEWFGKRLADWAFYRIFRRLARLHDAPLDSGDFAVLDRSVVDHLRALPERGRFLRGLRTWVGFKQVGVIYERHERYAGTTKYSYRKLFRLAFDGIFAFSYVPLRFATVLGFVVAVVALLGGAVLLYLRLVRGVIGVAGFSSIIISVLFIGAVQLISVGILGEYIGRIYDEVKRRPLYIVEEKVGFDLSHIDPAKIDPAQNDPAQNV